MKRVLIVDDEEDIRLLARLLLRQCCEVAEASSVAEAWELMETFSPDVLLLDVRLPGQDGWSMLQSLRDRTEGKKMRVIMLSAHAVSDAPEQARALGADGYITKPFRAEELLELIEGST
ncbi:MAG: response regulator [Actinomycetota bacterium]